MSKTPSKKPAPSVPAVRKTGAVAHPVDYGSVGGAGLENAGREDFAIPFLTILQKMSPQVERSDPNFIKGAAAGMILNTATGELFPGDEGVLVIPCFYRRTFVAWTIREKGGGFRGEYGVADPIVSSTTRDDKGRERLPDGNTQLVDTRLFGVLQIGEGGIPSPAIITMSSTQIKKAKRWCTQMQSLQTDEMRETGRQYPIFAHAYRLTTTGESNEKGSWDGWVIEHEGLLHEAIPGEAGQAAFADALKFYESLRTGAMKMRADLDPSRPGDEMGRM